MKREIILIFSLNVEKRGSKETINEMGDTMEATLIWFLDKIPNTEPRIIDGINPNNKTIKNFILTNISPFVINEKISIITVQAKNITLPIPNNY